MRSIRFCILGAGPSGLAFATALKAAGETSFVLLEKEATAGGLCRSMDVDGAPLDIGGGHFLDIRRQNVLDFFFDFMPKSEWAEHRRVSTIRLRNVEVEHPLEGNLWQLPLDAQVEFLESIAQAGCVRGEPEPKAFDEWIRWKLGARIAHNNYQHRAILCAELPESKGCEEFGTAAGNSQTQQDQPNEGTNP